MSYRFTKIAACAFAVTMAAPLLSVPAADAAMMKHHYRHHHRMHMRYMGARQNPNYVGAPGFAGGPAAGSLGPAYAPGPGLLGGGGFLGTGTLPQSGVFTGVPVLSNLGL